MKYDDHSIKTLSGTLVGTTAMTGCSYALSHSMKKQFREPVVLSMLVKRLSGRSDHGNHLEGWLLHYGVGALFNVVYDRIWRTGRFNPGIGNGLLLGALSGLIGLGVWKVTFNVHPDPPRIDFKKYYAQILAVHLIFGVFSALGHRSINTRPLKKKKDELASTLLPTTHIKIN